MISKLLVCIYSVVHGRLGLPGAGWLIRRLIPFVPGLTAYELRINGFGTARLDFRDTAAFGLLNFTLGDYGDDAHLLRWLDSALKPGDVLWDVGANIGYFALYFARPPHQLKAIHAFEPNPRAFTPLQSLFAGCEHVKVHAVGLGETDRTLEMNVSPIGSQLGTLVRTVEGGKTVSVDIRAGDNYRQEQGIPSPDVIKIDVEGFEPRVLEGLAGTIREKRPIIVLEHIWLSDEELTNLVPADYRLYFLMPDGALSEDFQTRMKGWNAVLMPHRIHLPPRR